MRASHASRVFLLGMPFVACFVTIDETKIVPQCGWDGGGEIDFTASVLSQNAVQLTFTPGPAYEVHRYEPGDTTCVRDWTLPPCTSSYVDDQGDLETGCIAGPDGGLHANYQYNYVITVLTADGGPNSTYPFALEAGIQTQGTGGGTPIPVATANELPQ